MKENDFFRSIDSEQLNATIVQDLQVIPRPENESCFVDNEEQGYQSQGYMDFRLPTKTRHHCIINTQHLESRLHLLDKPWLIKMML